MQRSCNFVNILTFCCQKSIQAKLFQVVFTGYDICRSTSSMTANASTRRPRLTEKGGMEHTSEDESVNKNKDETGQKLPSIHS